ncbi:MAG: hypothetical protein KBT31_01400 [Firmicutes bacterium]|nr:hypothetical protein [Candidatus Colimorpha enterica]
MKITYLGTAAAEGWPALFCNCESCKKALAAGGRNIRSRSQALINSDLLIDFPADSMWHKVAGGFDFSAVTDLIITHSHCDHFYPVDLQFRSDRSYSHELTSPTLNLYGNEAVLDRYYRAFGCPEKDIPKDAYYTIPYGVKPFLAEKFKPFKAGKYMITPLPARHDAKETCLNYLISDGEKTILYLHDTGLPFDETYAYLAANNVKADLVSYDCCYVVKQVESRHIGHMGVPGNEFVRDKLIALGVATPSTVHVINHFSHNGMLIYDELQPYAAEKGFVTTYDGMTIEI